MLATVSDGNAALVAEVSGLLCDGRGIGVHQHHIEGWC